MFISISAISTFTIPLYLGFTVQLLKSSDKESNKGSMVPIVLHMFIDYMKTWKTGQERFQNMLKRDHGPGIDWLSCIAQDEKCFLWHPHNADVSSDKHITDNSINFCPKDKNHISCVKLFSALANLKIQSSIAHCRNLPPNPAVTCTPIPQPRASIDWFKIPDHENTCVWGRESPNTRHQLGPLLHLTVEIET